MILPDSRRWLARCRDARQGNRMKHPTPRIHECKSRRKEKLPSFRHGCRNPASMDGNLRATASVMCSRNSLPCDWIPAVHAGMTGVLLRAIALRCSAMSKSCGLLTLSFRHFPRVTVKSLRRESDFAGEKIVEEGFFYVY